MKRFLGLFLLLGLLFLTACGGDMGEPNQYGLDYNGKQYNIISDGSGGIITTDGYTCQFTVSGRAGSIRFDVTYPDGSTYWWQEGEHGGHGGWSNDYDRDKYVPGDVLFDVLMADRRGTDNGLGGHIFLGLLIMVLGIFNAVKPELVWYLNHGWRFKNAEPSELALGVTRVGGVLVGIIGLAYVLLAGLFTL